jgi:hypothetical protein
MTLETCLVWLILAVSLRGTPMKAQLKTPLFEFSIEAKGWKNNTPKQVRSASKRTEIRAGKGDS